LAGLCSTSGADGEKLADVGFVEPRFTCQACGRKGADVRPNFDWEMEARRAKGLQREGDEDECPDQRGDAYCDNG
jgi:hypothetical protein